jgi:hypothetical protein
MRLRNACRAGSCESAFAVSDFRFWERLDFPLRVHSPAIFDVALPQRGYGRVSLAGHRNLLHPPRELLTFPAEPRLELPVRSPITTIPGKYILFSDGAGSEDRALTDMGIVDWLRRFLPVIRIGSSAKYFKLPMGERGGTRADLDLVNRTDLTEVFWLAKHATAIVSSCTFLRTMSSLMGTPVVELLQANRARPSTFSRTLNEYARQEFGITRKLNRWFVWDGESIPAEAASFIEECCASDR